MCSIRTIVEQVAWCSKKSVQGQLLDIISIEKCTSTFWTFYVPVDCCTTWNNFVSGATLSSHNANGEMLMFSSRFKAGLLRLFQVDGPVAVQAGAIQIKYSKIIKTFCLKCVVKLEVIKAWCQTSNKMKPIWAAAKGTNVAVGQESLTVILSMQTAFGI